MFEHLVVAIGDNMFIGVIVGALLQLYYKVHQQQQVYLIALATTGAIDIRAALPILFGCNIGTCITAMLASVGTNKTAHKAALLHLIFNVGGTIIFMPFIDILGILLWI